MCFILNFRDLILLLLLSGGVYGAPGFVGCMRLISIDGNYKLPTDWKDDVNINLLLVLLYITVHNTHAVKGYQFVWLILLRVFVD